MMSQKLPREIYQVAGISALAVAIFFAVGYVLLWGFAMSFGMSFDSAGSVYIAFYPLLLFPIVVISFVSRTAGFITMMGHVVVSWAVAAVTRLPSIYLNPLDSKISFVPFVILLLVILAFICSRQEISQNDVGAS